MDWDLQEYLGEMRKENSDQHRETNEKIDHLVEVINKHETRIQFVEATAKGLRWVIATFIVALFGAVTDFAVSHWPRFKGGS